MYNELLSYFKMKYFQPFGNFDYHIDSSHLFFCVPAVGWSGANTASKALTRSQWALPSKTTWWYLCFFQFCIRDYLGYCRLYAKSDLVQAKNLKVWTTLDIWSSKLKTSNFAIDPPGWRRLQTSQFSRESITVTSSPRTGSLMTSSNFFKRSNIKVIGHYFAHCALC